MPNAEALKETVRKVIDSFSEDLRSVSMDIHSHPELNFEEHHAHKALTGFLEGNGFAVTRGAYDMPTAFKAVAGSGGPTIAVMCEYDALPGIGHACGHNLIAISGLAAGLALKQALGEGNGTVVVFGSPAEEGGGGKVYMIERGAFEGIDAAMMLHPSPMDGAWMTSTARDTVAVDYHGKNAHAGAAPWEGINALDALVTAYNAISVLRQQIRPTDRIHGVFTKAGEKPNIIPDHTSAEFYVRSANMRDLAKLTERVVACFEAAALATGCRVDVRSIDKPYANLVQNNPMAEAYTANMGTLGLRLPTRQESQGGLGGASTDMGDVSYTVPSIHPSFAIPTDAVNHTPGFTASAATPQAHEATLRAAKALAMTAVDLFCNPEVLAAAKADFAAVRR